MFRLMEDGLPKDPEFPANLKELGYYITEDDKIRKIDKPDEKFQFYITDIWRWNEVQREAMHKCIRLEVERRLLGLCIRKLYMYPFDANKIPSVEKPDGPHVAIYATDPEKLRLKKRVLILVNDQLQDFGVLAYRILCGEGGINKGSVAGVVQELIRRSKQFYCKKDGKSKAGEIFDETEPDPIDSANGEKPGGTKTATAADEDDGIPGIVILNPGGRLYSFQMKENMSQQSWMARRRSSAVHPAHNIDEEYNLVEGHKTVQDHISSVFKQVVADPTFVANGAEVYVVGLYDGADILMDFLKEEYLDYVGQLSGMALINPSEVCCSEIEEINLATFLARRTRSWVRDDEILDTPLSIPPNSISQPKSVVDSDAALVRGRNIDGNSSKEKIDALETGRVFWTEIMNKEQRLSDNSADQTENIVSYLNALNSTGLGENAVFDSSESSAGSPPTQAQEAAAAQVAAFRSENFPSGAIHPPAEGVHVQDFADMNDSEETLTDTTPTISPPYNTPASHWTLTTATPNATSRRNTFSSPGRACGTLHPSASMVSISSSSGAIESSAFPMLSAGPNHEVAECVFPSLLGRVISFFEDISLTKPQPSTYRNPGFVIPDRVAKRLEEMATRANDETYHDASEALSSEEGDAGGTDGNDDDTPLHMEFRESDANHGKARLNEEDDELADQTSYATRLEDYVRRNEGLVSFAIGVEGTGEGHSPPDTHPVLPIRSSACPSSAGPSGSASHRRGSGGPLLNVGDRRMGIGGAGPTHGGKPSQVPPTDQSEASLDNEDEKAVFKGLGGGLTVPTGSPEKSSSGATATSSGSKNKEEEKEEEKEEDKEDDKDDDKEEMVMIAGAKVPKSLIEAAGLSGTPARGEVVDKEID
ncbi:hypothetical protein P152DRAFT_144656 [Eremomyces bilateralis CBS 781.70]|uniref:Arb2 domain-containing protein n=1 Tax=Eremomyces bilateralis CBS 781.70 TaxID=1392243 RepID=A0A6G1FWG7_9PEZI|nr:uncharacterized protein P152DRAFT_144656 [Eremomyces bilateralis CBS 781.70]KAF1809969.1 hypothetical protein P152DRAFT_144656 [Eremomyces bilateralis CBS 781.70]